MNLRRFVSGALLIPLVSLPAYFGGPLYFALILGISLMAAYEYDELMRGGGFRPPRRWGVLLILLLLADAAFPDNNILHSGLPLFVMLSLALLLRTPDLSGALINWALMLAGAVYIGVLLSQVIELRALKDVGLPLSALAAFATWASDSFALLFGLRFGRRRLAPRISPKKSWEGALGGGAVGVLVGVGWGYFTLPFPLYHLVALSLLIVVGGMFGDLAESLIKRQVGAKDAGGLIPGHGGVLDRIDSMMFAFPLTALYAVWILQLK